MSAPHASPRPTILYTELAEWWPLLSAPEDYAEEAAFYWQALTAASERPVATLLELGSGGGNNASHLKAHACLTLVEPSSDMRAVSGALNPECAHVEGDMRTVRLGHTFDAVFVHDAVGYMTTEADLRDAMETAWVHCAPGGAALFAPDHVGETFHPAAAHGGHDGDDGRALRYLEWTWDPDPRDATYVVDYAFLLRAADGAVRVAHDRHIEGLFSQATWLRLLAEVGFAPVVVPSPPRASVGSPAPVFVGHRPSG